MRLCSIDCSPVCDFCRYYLDDNEDGEFTGTGTCALTGIETDASEFCNSYWCFRAENLLEIEI